MRGKKLDVMRNESDTAVNLFRVVDDDTFHNLLFSKNHNVYYSCDISSSRHFK